MLFFVHVIIGLKEVLVCLPFCTGCYFKSGGAISASYKFKAQALKLTNLGSLRYGGLFTAQATKKRFYSITSYCLADRSKSDGF
jgi:hypothetical protein